jgi:hypothetical protein
MSSEEQLKEVSHITLEVHRAAAHDYDDENPIRPLSMNLS